MSRVGFVINPIAGMGGRVGLKGTDGVVEEAERRGAIPGANARAIEMLCEFRRLANERPNAPAVKWYSATGSMGCDALRAAGFDEIEIAHETATPPSAKDTQAAAQAFLDADVDIILFCGGDGTARDICAVVDRKIPVLGIPAGVKMYSGVFGVSPVHSAHVLIRYLAGEIGLGDAEIVDLDEDEYRRDRWAVRIYMAACTPSEPTYVQAAKTLIADAHEEDIKNDIAEHLREEIAANPDTLYLLGPGSTVQAVGRALRIDKTLLGIDAVAGGKTVGKDLGEKQILDLLDRYPRTRLVLSPIGAQGFVLGRGNQPLSPPVIRHIGADNIIVISTPAKLARTPHIRFDTGDAALDAEMISRKFLEVVIGYHRKRMVRIID